MEYQAGVLISRWREEEFGDYHVETCFRALRPVRKSLGEVEADLIAARLWIRRDRRKEAELARKCGPDNPYDLSSALPEYEIHIHVVQSTG